MKYVWTENEMFKYLFLNTCGAICCPLYILLFSRKLYNGMLERWMSGQWKVILCDSNKDIFCQLLAPTFFLFCVPFFFFLLTSSFTFSFCKEFLFCWPGRDLNLGPEMREELAHITLPTELFELTYWVSISLAFSFIHYMDTFKTLRLCVTRA